MTVQLAHGKHGRFLCLDNDVYIGRQLLATGLYSEGEVELFRCLVGPDDLVVEAGANVGAHTVPLSKMAGRVIAFEPQPFIYRLLCGNLALNGCDNVDVYPLAIGAEEGVTRLALADYGEENNFGGMRLTPENHGAEVPVIPIDRLGLTGLKLLKADVEGMELDVLRGAEETIARFRPFLYVEEDDENDPERERRALMTSLGYRVFEHHTVLLGPDDPLNHAPGYTIVSKNLLGVPNELDSPR